MTSAGDHKERTQLGLQMRAQQPASTGEIANNHMVPFICYILDRLGILTAQSVTIVPEHQNL